MHRERSIEKFAAERRHQAVKQLQHRDIVKLGDVIGNQSSTFVLAFASPETNTRAVLKLGIFHCVDNSFNSLPANGFPDMNLLL